MDEENIKSKNNYSKHIDDKEESCEKGCCDPVEVPKKDTNMDVE